MHGVNQSISEISQESFRKSESLGQKYGLDSKTSFQLGISAGTSNKQTFLSQFLPSLGVNISGRSESYKDELYEDFKNLSKEEGFSKNYQILDSSAKNTQFNASDDQGNRHSQSISDLFEKSQYHQKQFDKYIQQSENLSRLADVSNNQSISVNQKYNQEFVDYLSNQKMAGGNVRGRIAAQHIIRYSPHEREAAISQFMQTKQKEFITRHDLSTQEGFKKAEADLINSPINVDHKIKTPHKILKGKSFNKENIENAYARNKRIISDHIINNSNTENDMKNMKNIFNKKSKESQFSKTLKDILFIKKDSDKR